MTVHSWMVLTFLDSFGPMLSWTDVPLTSGRAWIVGIWKFMSQGALETRLTFAEICLLQRFAHLAMCHVQLLSYGGPCLLCCAVGMNRTCAVMRNP